MKKVRLISALSMLFCSTVALFSCNKANPKDIEFVRNYSKTHYLSFQENNVEFLSLVVLKGETYDDLLPYFPTLTAEPGFVKYWDGDYNYTDYSKDNQFKVYDEKDLIIEIYAYSKKVS